MSVWRAALIFACTLLAGAAGFLAHGWFWPAPAPGAVTAPASMTLAVGDLWQDLRLADTQGQHRQLHEWQGKLVVMNFWATWCAPCREEMPALQAVQDAWQERNLQIIGIALDRPDVVLPFLAEVGVSYPNLFGETAGGDIARLYGNLRGALPYTVLIDSEGIIRAQHLGVFDEASLKAWINDSLDD